MYVTLSKYVDIIVLIINNIITEKIHQQLTKYQNFTISHRNASYGRQFNRLIRATLLMILIVCLEWYVAILAYIFIVEGVLYLSVKIICRSITEILDQMEKMSSQIPVIYDMNCQILEYLKYKIMIAKGYQYRSNTNIMMSEEEIEENNEKYQHQKMQSYNNYHSAPQNLFEKMKLSAYQLTTISRLSTEILHLPDIALSINEKYSFRRNQDDHSMKIRQIINLNKTIKESLMHLQNFFSRVKFQRIIVSTSSIKILINYLKNNRKLIQMMKIYKDQQDKIFLIYQDSIKNIILEAKDRQIYQILTSQKNDGIQEKSDMINKCLQDILKQVQDNELRVNNLKDFQYCQQINEQQTYGKEESIDESDSKKMESEKMGKPDMNNKKDRLSFMKDLNTILIRGMNLRRQQAFQETYENEEDIVEEEIPLKKYRYEMAEKDKNS